MPRRMLRSAATVLVASAPLFTAAHARAASGDFPCAVAIQKFSTPTVSQISLSLYCGQARTVDVSVAAGGVELASLQEAVQAGVQRTVTLAVPKAPQVCATLRTDGASTVVCTPDNSRLSEKS
ncbi:hypothetical protein [Streptomyces sp. NPDC086519]|uniref:hypothetical protein n=1 Tax=Streptomyces sp. NPDC086519 TaxID=3154863 RepID=UPI0034267175